MKILANLTFLMLATAGQAVAASVVPAPTIVGKLVCSDINEQSITLIEYKKDAFYNGELVITGTDIISYFDSLGFMQGGDLKCLTNDDDVSECRMPARVSVDHVTAAHNGRYEGNFVVREDFGGAKMLVYFGSNNPVYYNWWFSECK